MSLCHATPRKIDSAQVALCAVAGIGIALVSLFDGVSRPGESFWTSHWKALFILLISSAGGMAWFWTTRAYLLDGTRFEVVRWLSRQVLFSGDARDVATVRRIPRKRFGMRSDIELTWRDGAVVRMPAQHEGVDSLVEAIEWIRAQARP